MCATGPPSIWSVMMDGTLRQQRLPADQQDSPPTVLERTILLRQVFKLIILNFILVGAVRLVNQYSFYLGYYPSIGSVVCNGSESTLTDCSFSPFSPCYYFDYAGAYCQGDLCDSKKSIMQCVLKLLYKISFEKALALLLTDAPMVLYG